MITPSQFVQGIYQLAIGDFRLRIEGRTLCDLLASPRSNPKSKIKKLFLTKTRTFYISQTLRLLRGMKYAPGSTVFCTLESWTVLFLLLF